MRIYARSAHRSSRRFAERIPRGLNQNLTQKTEACPAHVFTRVPVSD